MEFGSFGQAVVSFGIVLPRIGAAFFLLPYFSADIIPPLVRNVFLVSVALAVMPLVLHGPPPPSLTGTALVPVLLREVFIGIVIGFAFSIVFWALEAAGQIIDAKVGAGTAQLTDPLTGQQTSLIGAYLGRLGGYLFAAFGGLQVFTDLVLSSFQIWPIAATLPNLEAASAMFFVQRFDDLMRLALLLAAPVLCVLTLLELGFGFINRYAPQLNVFMLSMALKGWLAALILLLTVSTIVSFVVNWLSEQRGLLQVLPL